MKISERKSAGLHYTNPAYETKTVVAFDQEVFKNGMVGVLSESVEKIFTNVILKDGLLRPSA